MNLGIDMVAADRITLLLCGDVMLGRGIDQILPHPSDPRLFEPAITSALSYVALAERANGPIPRLVGCAYVWGDAIPALRHAAPDARIVNLETSITRSNHPMPKGINYRMNPANVSCLSQLGVDCCVLANNHVLDWDRRGLRETLDTLKSARIGTAGAGRDAAQAGAPAVIEPAGKGRVLVFGFATATSGVPPNWAAGNDRPGVNLLADLSRRTVERIAGETRAVRRPGDLLVASIHWGGNWGYRVSDAEREFAHRLIDLAGFDLVHGHSSHHPKGIELYRGKPILYGCGDFMNDYEGIEDHEAFRGDLALAYLPAFSLQDRRLIGLRLLPFRIRKFRLNQIAVSDAAWLRDRLDRESGRFGCRIALQEDASLAVVPR